MSDLSKIRRGVVAISQTDASPSNGVRTLSIDGSSVSVPFEKSAVKASTRIRPMVTALMFGLAALALLLPGLGTPPKMFFDEPYFVPEARAFIQGIPNPAPDAPPLAKPPLGKLIMALGMEAAGDNPFGWRIAGVVSGALTVVAVYLWVYLLLQDASLASLAAGLALFNNFLFVMSRIATVDVFLLFFLMWSLVAYTAALRLDVEAGPRRILFCSSGILVGLAGACKWNAVDTLGVFFFLTFALLWVSRRETPDSLSSLSAYARNVKKIGLPVLLIGLILAPIVSYSLAFWPVCRSIHRPFSFRELAAMNVFMWHFNRTTVVNPFLISPWYSWPLNMSPMRVLSYLVGNPMVTWSGLAALALCLRRFWMSDTLPKAMVLLLFAANYLQWAVTPQKGLYYYYYYPCVMFLGVAIAVATRSLPPRLFGLRISFLVLVAAAIFFVRCYPQMAHLEAPWDCTFGCWP
jgi:dolichyl-phosphate-mannose-protein mannosyltransferase